MRIVCFIRMDIPQKELDKILKEKDEKCDRCDGKGSYLNVNAEQIVCLDCQSTGKKVITITYEGDSPRLGEIKIISIPHRIIEINDTAEYKQPIKLKILKFHRDKHMAELIVV